MMTETIKKQVIRKLLTGDCAFGIGQRNGERVVSVTVTVPHNKDLCKNHHRPVIYFKQNRLLCERCLDAVESYEVGQYVA